jgi:hypothetical protein
MHLIGMDPHLLGALGPVFALPALEPIHGRDDGLWGQPILGQWDARIIVRIWEFLDVSLNLPFILIFILIIINNIHCANLRAQLRLDRMLLAQMLDDAGRADRLATATA